MNGRVALPLDQSFGPRDPASNRREKSHIKQQMQRDASRGEFIRVAAPHAASHAIAPAERPAGGVSVGDRWPHPGVL